MNAAETPLVNRSGIVFVVLALIVMFSMSLSLVQPGHASDRHAGYYYPEPQSEEAYQAPTRTLPGVSRLSRVGFVTQLDQLQKKRPYAPAYHMFAKGSEAEKLIIIATEEGRYDTLYRLRGLLASMTADARTSPLFAKLGNVERLNVLDLLHMAGFKQLTITNGDDVAHRVNLY